MNNANTCDTKEQGYQRLRDLVARSYAKTYYTRSGVLREKTRKQIEMDHAVAEEVVRFAFDHGGYRGKHLAPGGLWDQLATELRIHVTTDQEER